MANMHEIKMRIKSIKETRQITKAMNLVSAAKLKKARRLLEQTLPYFDKVKVTIADILTHSSNIKNPFFDVRYNKPSIKKGYIVLTGDKGLSGSYNHNIIKITEENLKGDKQSVLFIAGHMGRSYFIRNDYNVNLDFDYPIQNPTVYRAREISEMILDLYKKNELDEVYLIYTLMESAIKLELQFMKLLPLDLELLRETLEVSGESLEEIDDSMTYEPSPEAVLDVLISKYVKGILYGAFVEAFTSEQSARMYAMDNATQNADEMLQSLNLLYNRARQAAITQEISEIVGGAGALL